MIDITNTSKTYISNGNTTIAINKLDLTIKKGEFVIIMGPSGSGKTTLLNLIAGLTKPSEGIIKINKKDISSMNDKELSNLRLHSLGLIFQFYNLHDGLTALENVELPLLISKMKPLMKRRNFAKEKIDLVGLENLANKYPHELSGGEKQRVGIARAIVNSPNIILADEPTGDLDSSKAYEIIEILKTIHKQGNTIVVVTHDFNLVSEGMRLILLESGDIKKDLIFNKDEHKELESELLLNYTVEFIS